MKRTHTCGELTAANDGAKVELHGWVDSVRDHGGLLFVDLRDRYGHTQVVFRSEESGLHKTGETLRPEWVIGVEGTVRKRTSENVNPKVATGGIEVEVERLTVHNEAITPPFEIRDDLKVGEDVRLQYRYIDLRRPRMQKHFVQRSKMLLAIREAMEAQGFIDIETPSMVKFTPGGARNFLVPSRHFPGHFFAMAESPQIFKQLFMVSGLDRYYQVARCWRDEDLRADRQLEFTQLDVEMSFVEPDDIMTVIEGVMKEIWKKVLDVEIAPPFERIPYDEAVRDYGSDKPDLRFGMKIRDVSEVVKDVSFKVFSGAVASGGVVRGLVAKGCAGWSRKQITDLEGELKGIGAKGLAWFKVEEGGLTGGPSKFFEPERQKKMIETMGAKAGDLLLFLADEEESCAYMLGWLRNRLRDILDLVKTDDYRFCWIVDFPMFEYSEEEEEWVARHHPFTMPREEDLERLQSDPKSVKAKAYDLVLNGVEIGGGSIRIHQRDVQETVFKALGLSDEYIRDRFQFLLDAFRYGAPPHGGIALGVDRLAMLVLGLESIRDTIAFPKTQRTIDLMTGAPTEVSERQLKDLHLKVVQPE